MLECEFNLQLMSPIGMINGEIINCVKFLKKKKKKHHKTDTLSLVNDDESDKIIHYRTQD